MCNCTSYVAWALQAHGQRTDWFVAGAMDTWNLPHVARLAGLEVGRTPRVGSVAVWPKLSPPFGHVAYVTGVERDGGIDVSEYNEPDGPRPFAFDQREDVRRARRRLHLRPESAGAAPLIPVGRRLVAALAVLEAPLSGSRERLEACDRALGPRPRDRRVRDGDARRRGCARRRLHRR